MPDSPDRIDYDEHGNLDDIVISNVTMFRMERMDQGAFWIRLYRDDEETDVVFWLGSPRKITGRHEFEKRS